MYAGEIVERAPADALFEAPQHPYTVGLLASIPRLDLRADRARRDRRRAARHGVAAGRLPLRRPLPVRAGRMPRRAAAGRRARRALVALPARAARKARRMTALVEAEGLVKHFVARRSRVRPAAQPCEGGRRRRLHGRGRKDAGAGRRVRLRQVHGRAAGAAPDRADRGTHALRRAGRVRAERGRRPRVPPPGAARLPGPLRLAQSAHDGRRHSRPSRSRCTTSCRRRGGASASPNCSTWSGCSRASRRAIRTNSPAASASAS